MLVDPGMKRHDRGERQAVNIRRALITIERRVAGRDWELTESSIRELNRVVLDGIPGESYSAGDYKRRQNWVLDGRLSVVFVPPPPGESQELVSELTRTVNREIAKYRTGSRDAWHPIRIAAIACGRLIAIHPFAHGNGRTSRAVATMILAAFGYAPRPSEHHDESTVPVKTLEWYFDQHPSDYYAGLQAARRGNWPIWLDVFAEAVQATMNCPVS